VHRASHAARHEHPEQEPHGGTVEIENRERPQTKVLTIVPIWRKIFCHVQLEGTLPTMIGSFPLAQVVHRSAAAQP
jgi:hypothetical protein